VITREQIATILYRYEEFKNGAPAVEGDLKAFPDAANVSDFAATAMIWANQNGIINGVTVDNVAKLAPKASATREQIASIMMRYLEAE
ncbi:MAG: S-layer protein, partial [Ruminococcaceae bacterium]|nr:S-layer protein [Oscillospiraceae bacterium]